MDAAPSSPVGACTGRRAALVVAAALLAGCPPAPRVERPYPPPSAAELVAHLRARAARTRTLRTEAKVDYLAGKGERIKLTMSFLVERPARVRVDAESPVGGATVMSLASDGRDFQLLDVRQNRFLSGAATPCNLGRLLRVRLGPEDLVEVISGGAPLLGEPVSVAWKAADGGREVLTLRTPSGARETIELAGERNAWDVMAVETTGPDGKLLYRLTHEGWSDEGGARFPSTSHIEEPARDGDARIRYRSREPGVVPPDGAFRLAAPAGLPVESVRCDE